MQALVLTDEMTYAGALLVLKRLAWRDNVLRECSSCCPHETLWIDLDYVLTRLRTTIIQSFLNKSTFRITKYFYNDEDRLTRFS